MRVHAVHQKLSRIRQARDLPAHDGLIRATASNDHRAGRPACSRASAMTMRPACAHASPDRSAPVNGSLSRLASSRAISRSLREWQPPSRSAPACPPALGAGRRGRGGPMCSTCGTQCADQAGANRRRYANRRAGAGTAALSRAQNARRGGGSRPAPSSRCEGTAGGGRGGHSPAARRHYVNLSRLAAILNHEVARGGKRRLRTQPAAGGAVRTVAHQ